MAMSPPTLPLGHPQIHRTPPNPPQSGAGGHGELGVPPVSPLHVPGGHQALGGGPGGPTSGPWPHHPQPYTWVTPNPSQNGTGGHGELGVPPLRPPHVSLVATRPRVVAQKVPVVAHRDVPPNPTPGSPPNPSQNGPGGHGGMGVPPLRPPYVSLVATRPRVVAQKVPLVAYRDVPPNPTPGSPQNPLIPPNLSQNRAGGHGEMGGPTPVSPLRVLGGHQAPGGGPEGPTGGPQRCPSQPYTWVTPKSVPEWAWGSWRDGGPTPASPLCVLGGHQVLGGGPGGPTSGPWPCHPQPYTWVTPKSIEPPQIHPRTGLGVTVSWGSHPCVPPMCPWWPPGPGWWPLRSHWWPMATSPPTLHLGHPKTHRSPPKSIPEWAWGSQQSGGSHPCVPPTCLWWPPGPGWWPRSSQWWPTEMSPPTLPLGHPKTHRSPQI